MPDAVGNDVEVREVPLATTLSLRSRVLRDHLPGLPSTSEQDEHPGTWHLGAYRGDALLGVVSGFAQEAPGRPGAAAQRFRFMAVEPSEQRRGVGAALIAAVIGLARARGAELLWANGRDTALEFYTRLGFEVVGESFVDSPSRLPHHVIVLEL